VLVGDLQSALGLPHNPHQASTGAIILARMTSAYGSVSVRARTGRAHHVQRPTSSASLTDVFAFAL
jgi:hypothetical protein